MQKARRFNGVMRIAAAVMAMIIIVTAMPMEWLPEAASVSAAEGDTFISPDGERPENNIAPDAKSISTSYVSDWEDLYSVNDGMFSSTSRSAKYEGCYCYGSWAWEGARSTDSETITYVWEEEMLINSTGIYYWYDGDTPTDGGIKIPKASKFEYLNENGDYVEVENANGLGCEPDGFNMTTFDEIKTTSLRVTMIKQAADNTGVGVIEWEVYGDKAPVNIALNAEASASINRPEDLGGIAALNNGVEPTASLGIGEDPIWHSWTNEGQIAWVQYDWEEEAIINSTEVYYFTDNGGIVVPQKTVVEYWDADTQTWAEAAVKEDNELDQYNVTAFEEPLKTTKLRLTMTPQGYGTGSNHAVGIREWKVWGNVKEKAEILEDIIVDDVTIRPLAKKGGYTMFNDAFSVTIGKYGHINELKITNDLYDTNYVLNPDNAKAQAAGEEHQWMGELMFQTKFEGDSNWTESMTSVSQDGSTSRTIELSGKQVIVTYENAAETKGIKDFKLVETYELIEDQVVWSMTVTNTKDKAITFGDFGIPMPFNEYWSKRAIPYEESVVDHSFVGQDSSYIYATRPSGQGQFLLFTPDPETGAGLEYQDHWRTNNGHSGSAWAQDQAGWANGLNVFYIHSDVIKSSGSSYLENTALTLQPGESKTYTFKFTGVNDEADMKKRLYEEEIIDTVAVPSMTFAKNMPAKFYLHTSYGQNEIADIEVKCTHESGIYEGLRNSVSIKQGCTKAENTRVQYVETVVQDGEQYHIYDLKLSCLGVNHVEISYGDGKKTTLQFYIMDNVDDALELHAEFVTEKTQVNAPGEIYDKLFDDWMMDTKSVRGIYKGYFGWGDDWGFTHGEYLAEKNVYQPVKEQIEALDEYLDTFIWNSLMREHHEDYLVNDWLDDEPNNTGQGVNRGYAYLHVYNTYFAMYEIAEKYPDIVDYIEDKDTYLLRTYSIMKALYDNNIAYAWDGLMGESTTPDIIAALQREGYYTEAQYVINRMGQKYNIFKNNKYPYGSEYTYDNTGEEAVYTLAKLNNNLAMMENINAKTRACRGVQPIWYHYGNPTTICGENWWNFQYTASLAGYCMDDWLRLQDNGMTEEEMADAARVNYAGKLANLTSINSGQIDADPENIGTVAWTYQAELGNSGGQGTGGGNIHNGWRQMSGEADTGLFGALRILSSDVVTDNIFGLFGYGCEVTDDSTYYLVNPLDGAYTRLNFINEKLSVELNRDQYSEAKVSKAADYVELNMKNLEISEHESNIEFTGLKEGSYQVLVNGEVKGSFRQLQGKTTTVSVPLPAAATAKVVIQEGQALENTAPQVEAGKDQTLSLSDSFRLEGTVRDDGYPNMTLTSTWEVISKPNGAEVIIADTDKLISNITVDKAGVYRLKLTVSDGALSADDTVTITVNEDPALSEVLANYTFTDVDNIKRVVKDASSSGNDAEAISKPALTEGKNGNAISLTGAYCGYIKLPASLTRRVTECTILTEIKLNATQDNGARLFQFGDTNGKKLYISFEGRNELILGVTSGNETKKYNTGAKLGSGYWKHIALTVKDRTITLYVNGEAVYELNDCDFTLADLGKTQQNYIGRSEDKMNPFLNGLVDSFTVKSVAMSASEIKEQFGSDDESKAISAVTESLVTVPGTAPVLPETCEVLFDDGQYRVLPVIWNEIPEENFANAGVFTVRGKAEGLTISVKAIVYVAGGEESNLASGATPTAIVDTPHDLGGVAGLNDGYEPSSSGDTSHGAWHNWLGGNINGDAWVCYTWSEPVILTGSDAYYFRDGNMNFIPSAVKYEYLNSNGEWIEFSNVSGLGVEANKYNKTTWDPVVTTSIRMTLTPMKDGSGVVEWKVYGETGSDSSAVDLRSLRQFIEEAESEVESQYTSDSWSEFSAKLLLAKEIANKTEPTLKEVDAAYDALELAMSALVRNGTVIKTELERQIVLAEEASEDDYTSENWLKLTEALNKAKEIAEKPGATQDEVDAAEDVLKKAIQDKKPPVDPVDKSQLQSKITEAEGKLSGNYTEESLNNLNTVLEEAKRILADDNALQTDVDAAKESLEVAINALQPQEPPVDPADKSQLQSKITEAEGKLSGNYTEESLNNLNTVLEEAKRIMADDNALQTDVDAAKESLEDAINALQPQEPPVDPADKSQLQSKITEAEGKLSGNYTEESLNNLKLVLEEAKKVLANDNALQTDVDAAKEELEEAIKALQTPPTKPDKSELQKTIKAYEGLKKADYTAASWAAYEKVLNTAKQINNDPNATKAQVDNALIALKKAYNSLVKPPVVPKIPANGTIHTKGKAKYKVTKSAAKNGTVTFMKPLKKTYKKVTIPATVKINGYTFKVTAVDKKAFYKNKKLESVTIGKNVKTIGKSAFAGCKKLKKITFKGMLIKKVYKFAFRNIKKNAVFKIPSSKVKAYKKLLLGAGAKNSMTFKKVK